jgi:hypothetical protein
MPCAKNAVARRAINDRGAMRVMTVTKVVVAMAVLGVFGYDTVACMADHAKTEDNAQDAAYAASQSWLNTKNIYVAYAAAQTTLKTENPADQLIRSSFSIDPDGTAHLKVTRTAKTLVIGHIGFLKHYTVATEKGDANSFDSS